MNGDDETIKQIKRSITAKAAAGGHNLGAFRDGYDSEGVLVGRRAFCRRCGGVIWITAEGTGYYLLQDPCGDRE